MRKLATLILAIGTLGVAPLILAPAAVAAPAVPSVLDGNVTCEEVTAAGNVPGSAGQTWCGTIRPNDKGDDDQPISSTLSAPLPSDRSTVKSFDDVPIDVNVALPDPVAHGGGPYPLVMMFHGYGGSKISFAGMQGWLSKGYAVFSQTNRGFHESCGTPGAKVADPVCNTKGFVRLDDTRYEVRDAQIYSGMMVDESLVQPDKVAASGGSYGGGMTMALAALKNRIMMPDGSLTPWQSPMGTAMSLAVGIPTVPWTDLAYSLTPNGSNLDYIKDASYYGRFGVMKQSYVNGLYIGGLIAPGYYAPAGTQPEADLAGWKNFMDAGEPYDGQLQADQMLDEITSHHSSYYIDHSVAPAPLLIGSGFTDDLFPVNEATRFANRTLAEYPNAPIGLFFGSFGHPRGQSQGNVAAALGSQQEQWVDHYLTGAGAKPKPEVTTYTQTCPDGTPGNGPYVSEKWGTLARGEIRVQFKDGSQTVSADGGDPAVASAFNPDPTGGGDGACAEAPGAKEAGTANYETDPAPAPLYAGEPGYTVMGSPTVIAEISLPGDDSQIAARLVDVSPDGQTKTLVARALWRPTQSGYQVFQLNANGWKVEKDHVLRLELLPKDAAGDAGTALGNYGRPSDNQQDAIIGNVDLRIPVVEGPGQLDGLVKAPAPRVLPDRPGVELAPGNEDVGSISLADYAKQADADEVGKLKVKGNGKVKGKALTAKVTCAKKYDRCKKATFKFQGISKKRKGLLARKSGVKVGSGKTKQVKFKLTKKGRKVFRNYRKAKAKVLIGGKKSGKVAIKRVGKVR